MSMMSRQRDLRALWESSDELPSCCEMPECMILVQDGRGGDNYRLVWIWFGSQDSTLAAQLHCSPLLVASSRCLITVDFLLVFLPCGRVLTPLLLLAPPNLVCKLIHNCHDRTLAAVRFSPSRQHFFAIATIILSDKNQSTHATSSQKQERCHLSSHF